jgi:replicative DNA helicase
MLLAAARACKPDHQVGIVSLEMSKKWLMHRLAAQVAGVDATAVEDGDPSLPWERIDAALDEIEQLPLRIVDAEDAVSRVNGSHGHMTPEVIRHLVQGWHQQATLDLVAVDYLEMVSVPEGMEHDLHTEQLGAIALAFRNLASELKIPVLVLAQLNRDSTKSASKVPTLEGIHNSDKPAMHADVVLFPVRWDYYRDRGQELPEDVASLPRGVTDILIAKQRNGGVGMARAYFDTASQRFLDWNEQRKCAVDYHGNIVAIEVAMSHQGQKA